MDAQQGRPASIQQSAIGLVLLASHGGPRFGELGALRRARVDLLRSRVTVAETLVDVHGQPLAFGPPKTKGSRRTVRLPRTIATQLGEHLVALWVAAGVNPKEVSVRAGHSSSCVHAGSLRAPL